MTLSLKLHLHFPIKIVHGIFIPRTGGAPPAVRVEGISGEAKGVDMNSLASVCGDVMEAMDDGLRPWKCTRRRRRRPEPERLLL